MGGEKGLGGHSGQDPGSSFGGLDRTWDLLVFDSFLFGKAGAQAWSSRSTLVLLMLSGSISRTEQLGTLARSVGGAASVSAGIRGPKGWARWHRHLCLLHLPCVTCAGTRAPSPPLGRPSLYQPHGRHLGLCGGLSGGSYQQITEELQFHSRTRTVRVRETL